MSDEIGSYIFLLLYVLPKQLCALIGAAGHHFTYWHIETEAHEIILTGGAPAEIFVDTVTRRSFDNWQEYEALYPDAPPMVELDLPRVKYRRQLPRVISRCLDGIADSLLGREAAAA